MKTLLMLAQWYPPCQAWPTAAARTRLLTANLPEHGWRPVLLVPDLSGGVCRCEWCDRPEFGDIDDGPDVVVHRLSTRRSVARIVASRAARHRPTSLTGDGQHQRRSHRIRPSLERALWLLGDAHSDWHRVAFRHADQLLRGHRIDALWTTSAPFSHLRMGARLSRRHGIPWIADLRDPVSTDVTAQGWMMSLARARRSTYRRPLLEAEAITAAIQHVAEVDGPWLGRNPTLIPHGFDRAPWFVARSRASQRTDRLEIVYTGKLYEHHQRLDIFLRGLRLAAETLPGENGGRPHFVYYGRSGDLLRQHAMQLRCEHLVEVRGFVPPPEVPEKMASASVLLLLTIDRGSTGVPGGKLYDYLAAHRPILAVPGGGHVAEVLGETGAGVVACDYRQVADQIGLWLSQWRTSGQVNFQGDTHRIDGHAATESARRLAELLEEVTESWARSISRMEVPR